MTFEQILITAIAAGASVLGVGMLIPQIRHLRKTRSSDGVSGAWIGAGIAINLGWVAYGVLEEIWILLPVSGVSMLLYLWILRLVAPDSVLAARDAIVVTIGLLAILTLAGVLTGPVGLGFSLSASYTVQFAPAAWTAMRQSDLSGISKSTWIMAMCEAVLWAVWGTAISDLPITLAGSGATLMSALILACLFTPQRRAVLPGVSTSPKTVPTAPLEVENT